MRYLISALNCCKQIQQHFPNRFEMIDLISNTNNKDYKSEKNNFKLENENYKIVFGDVITSKDELFVFKIIKDNKETILTIEKFKNVYVLHIHDFSNGIQITHKRNKFKLYWKFDGRRLI